MEIAVILGTGRAGITKVPIPEPKEDWALVKVHVAPMCTEYKEFVAGQRNAVLGHEAVGEVVALAQPGRAKIGDRVVVMPTWPCGKCSLCAKGEYIYCRSPYDYNKFADTTIGAPAMAQYILKPTWLLPSIPQEVSYERASLALCALGPTFGAMQSMATASFDTVMITGAGPVGLGGIVNARYRGARVIVVDGEPWRQGKSVELGAELVLDPRDPDRIDKVLDFTKGNGVDMSLECSGVVDAQRLCIDVTRRRGQVAFVGESMQSLSVTVSPDLIRKGLTLFGSWHYSLSDFPRIMQVIQGSPSVDSLISHVFPLSRIQEAFETCVSLERAKVLLKPWGE